MTRDFELTVDWQLVSAIASAILSESTAPALAKVVCGLRVGVAGPFKLDVLHDVCGLSWARVPVWSGSESTDTGPFSSCFWLAVDLEAGGRGGVAGVGVGGEGQDCGQGL